MTNKQELTWEVNLCALAVSTITLRHRWSVVEVRKQWKPIDLADEVNSLPYADDANFNVHPLILQHGLIIFRSVLSGYFGVD